MKFTEQQKAAIEKQRQRLAEETFPEEDGTYYVYVREQFLATYEPKSTHYT